MDLTITKKHTRYARRQQSNHCPTARAFRDVGFKTVSVGNETVMLNWEVYDLPETLKKAIDEFDSGKPFRSGTYRIAGVERPKARAK